MIKLRQIFESVINGKVDLTSYPNLKKVVDTYKHARIDGNPIIRPEDFDSLMDTNDVNTKDFTDLISKRQYNVDLVGDVPQYRIYNLHKGLLGKLQNINDPHYQDYKSAYEDLQDLLLDINKVKTTYNPNQNKKKEKPVVDGDHTMSIASTVNLKSNNVVQFEGQDYFIDDRILSVFKNHGNDPNVSKYGDAILKNQTNLPDDVASDEGLVYTLFKKLRTECTELITTVTNLKYKMSKTTAGQTYNKIGDKQGSYSSVDTLPFSSLHSDVSRVKFIYNLYNENGSPYNGKLINYGGTFTYSSLVHKHRFINTEMRSNEFSFYRNNFASIEVGQKYKINYTLDDGRDIDLIIDILSIEVLNNNKSNTDFTRYIPCSSMTELHSIVASMISTKYN